MLNARPLHDVPLTSLLPEATALASQTMNLLQLECMHCDRKRSAEKKTLSLPPRILYLVARPLFSLPRNRSRFIDKAQRGKEQMSGDSETPLAKADA